MRNSCKDMYMLVQPLANYRIDVVSLCCVVSSESPEVRVKSTDSTIQLQPQLLIVYNPSVLNCEHKHRILSLMRVTTGSVNLPGEMAVHCNIIH